MYLNRAEQDVLEEQASSINVNLSKLESCGKGLTYSFFFFFFPVEEDLRNRFQLHLISTFSTCKWQFSWLGKNI